MPSREAGLQIGFFCDPVLTCLKARSAPVLEKSNFRRSLAWGLIVQSFWSQALFGLESLKKPAIEPVLISTPGG
jgi:hypothetical protein